jgi:alpha-L-fucosidase
MKRLIPSLFTFQHSLFTIHYSLFTILALCSTLFALRPVQAQYVADPDPLAQAKLSEWQDLKFGLLMHWGPYSQWGVVESWSICAEDEGWCRRKSDDYTAYKKEYEGLKTTFNPVHFDPAKWAGAARDAGMRYVVFTTKHHDGFCMFDTRQTDYKVTDPACPFSANPKANIAKNIFDAFRREGLWTGAYFSKPDWHCPDYWWPNFATPDRNVNYDIKTYPDRWENYVQFTHNQIMELMSDYGKMDILWLDGGWVRTLTDAEISRYINSPDYKFMHIQSQDIRMDELVEKARAKQPGLIVVDRAVPGKNQNYLTPENEVPEHTLPYPWESCIIAGGSWSWVPDAKYKTPQQVIHLLVDIVAKGGNLLLNIAPGPDGNWDQGAYDMLSGTGDWMAVNSEAIYGTKPLAPYKEGKVCLTQGRDGAVYMIYLADENELYPPAKIWFSSLAIPGNASAVMLGSREKLAWEKVGSGILVHVPEGLQKKPPCGSAWVIKIAE